MLTTLACRKQQKPGGWPRRRGGGGDRGREYPRGRVRRRAGGSVPFDLQPAEHLLSLRTDAATQNLNQRHDERQSDIDILLLSLLAPEPRPPGEPDRDNQRPALEGSLVHPIVKLESVTEGWRVRLPVGRRRPRRSPASWQSSRGTGTECGTFAGQTRGTRSRHAAVIGRSNCGGRRRKGTASTNAWRLWRRPIQKPLEGVGSRGATPC